MQPNEIEIVNKAWSIPAFLILASMSFSNLLWAAPLNLSEADLVSNVRIGYASTSNVFRSAESPIEATGIVVSPDAKIIAKNRGLELELGYSGRFGAFSVEELNFDDHELFLNTNAVIGSRKRASVSAFLRQGYDSLGEGATRGVAGSGSEQIKHVTAGISGFYTYGAGNARLNLTGGLLLEAFDYQNRSDIVGGRDFSEIAPYAEVSYRLSSDLRATTEFRVRSINSDSGLYDRTELQGLVGFSFRGTGKSGGSFKVGVSNASYSDVRIADRSILTARAQLYTMPTSFSRFDLSLLRKLNDLEEVDVDTGAEQSIDTLAAIRWTHNWSAFVRTETSFSLDDDNRNCPELGSKSTIARFDLFYDVLNWVEIGIGLSQTERSGDDCSGSVDVIDLDYERQDARVFVKFAL